MMVGGDLCFICPLQAKPLGEAFRGGGHPRTENALACAMGFRWELHAEEKRDLVAALCYEQDRDSKGRRSRYRTSKR